MIYILLFILLLINLFFIVNSIIWLKDKHMININDIIVKYIIYFDFCIYTLILLFLVYLYFNNLAIKIL
jgi:hypothetical protein|uniref:Uncharacterized protein n=1 Tax=viral metagenome TaxID=1070528 RepID=A0A6C0ETA0_9ZZZZ